MKKLLLLSLIFLASCSLDKVIQHHGVHNLEKKQAKLKINSTNKNDIIKLIGPPSTKSSFDNDIYIYLERKTSSSRLTRLGKKRLIKNDVLVLEIDEYGILKKKSFYNQDDMKIVKIVKDETNTNFAKNSFIYDFMSSMRQKMNDPLGTRAKKREAISQR